MNIVELPLVLQLISCETVAICSEIILAICYFDPDVFVVIRVHIVIRFGTGSIKISGVQLITLMKVIFFFSDLGTSLSLFATNSRQI